jgi:hypothetical protein
MSISRREGLRRRQSGRARADSRARVRAERGLTPAIRRAIDEGTVAALKARTGKRGMSAYVETLIQRQLERDRLRELIEDAEAEHGPVDQTAVEAKRALLRGDAAGSADAA